MNFSTQKTMRLAQQLYEGVDVKGQGTVGIITYLRTDSVRVSEEADASAREYDFRPQKRADAVSHHAVQHSPGLLGVHQIHINLSCLL